MAPQHVMLTARLRAKVRACRKRYGREFDAPLPINQRIHVRNHGSHLPRITPQ